MIALQRLEFEDRLITIDQLNENMKEFDED
jgi:hypothetical protein